MKAVIERIGDPTAVLVLPDRDFLRFNIPSVLLPEGCSEGDIITVSLAPDHEATREAQDRVARLINGLMDQ
ncbi:DUF3006 domain-containing protein [Methanoregula sp. UBA64]|jgi:hypothetical protein|uniref:DUF3006 domain-containing protein n=1 Tax=Methanoregula sp. UBA64 TaxID=1915554 RepID=UPI0025EE9203|nr:DUF3006 domain-containing protein [Methanoregula sp. UBA64]